MPKAPPPKPKPAAPEAEPVPPAQPSAEAAGQPPQSDELADFFGIKGGEEPVTPQQMLVDMEEAKRPAHVRRSEINHGLTDPENQLTKSGREAAAAIARQMEVKGDYDDLKGLFGDDFVSDLQKAESADVEAVIKVVKTQIEDLDGGKGDIFVNLGPDQATATEGARRREGQTKLHTLKAAALGISEAAFASGELELGIQAFEAAQISMITDEPVWWTDAATRAISKADINDPKVRQALHRFQENSSLGTLKGDEQKVADKLLAELTGKDAILKQVIEAEAIDRRLAEEDRQAKLKQEYDEQMNRYWKEKMAEAVSDGRSAAELHIKAGNSTTVHFKDYGRGSSHLAAMAKDWKFSAGVTGEHKLSGIRGHLQVLTNVLETPGFLDELVAREAKEWYTDAGGKSKSKYEEEGRLDDWNAMMRRNIMTEIQGHAFGCLQTLIEYEGKGITDPERRNLLQGTLEIIGQGRAYKTVLGGEGELTSERSLIRQMFTDYIKNPQAPNEKFYDNEKVLKTNRIQRLKALATVSQEADVQVMWRQKEADRAARELREAEEKRREAIKATHAKSEAHLTAISGTKKDLLDVQAKGTHLKKLFDSANVLEFVVVDQQDKGDPPTVNISVNEKRAEQTTLRIKEIKAQLSGNPEDARKLRDELARTEVDQRLLIYMRTFVNSVNSAKRVQVRDLGFFRGGKVSLGALANDAFRRIPDEAANWVGSAGDVADAIKNIDAPKPEGSYAKTKEFETLADLATEVANQKTATDMLPLAEVVNRTEADLSEREARAQKIAGDLSQKADKFTLALAGYFIRNKLHAVLEAEHRINFA